MRRVLIITPYFPPSNAADMHRTRISLPFFKEHGWEAEVVTVDPVFSDLLKDDLLSQSVPNQSVIHLVKALPKKLTSKIGLGSIAIRSIWFYLRVVNRLLKHSKYDLVYFSTTQFPVCILGVYWKKRFGVPYVIDMQDPWHSEYYHQRHKADRPRKYWFSYRLNKWLEPIAMKEVSGLISVSQAYIDDLKKRYAVINQIPSSIITFGACERDLQIAEKNIGRFKLLVKPEKGRINIVYIGRGGHDMHNTIRPLFMALLKGLTSQEKLFKQFRISFIGTSYAPEGKGNASIKKLATDLGLKNEVIEITDRIGFYEAIATLQKADILFLPGSDDPKYTASKLYPYLMSQKPLLAILHEKSSAVSIVRSCSPDAVVYTFPDDKDLLAVKIYNHLLQLATTTVSPLILNKEAFEEYSANTMAARQTGLFNRVVIDKLRSSAEYNKS